MSARTALRADVPTAQLPADGERIFVRMQTWKGVFAAELVVGCLQCGLPAQGTARSSGTTDVHGAHDGAIDEAQADETSDAAGAPDVTLGVGDPDDGSVGGSYDASVVDHLSEAGLGAPADALGDADASVMNCGGSPCDLSSNVCCTCANCSLPFPTGCFPAFPGCEPSGTYMVLTCSAHNCSGTSVCCASFSSSALSGASCFSSCATGDVQLCASDAECPHGQTCSALSSIPGFTGCQ
jgi:hypothetical protein